MWEVDESAFGTTMVEWLTFIPRNKACPSIYRLRLLARTLDDAPIRLASKRRLAAPAKSGNFGGV